MPGTSTQHYVKQDDDCFGEDHISLNAGPSDSETTNKINIENDTRNGIDGTLGKNSISSRELFHIFDKTQRELLAHMDGIRSRFEDRLAQQGALSSHSGVGPAERIGDG